MKYFWSFYLWENGHKSTDYTKYLVVPIYVEDRANEELDTAEVVLDRMDISTKEGFAPKTKFRLELRLNKTDIEPFKKWDYVVEHDDVEFYAGCPNICCHRVHLIEPSAIAQGMHVDNIALTYELQDVTLNYKVIENSTDTVSLNNRHNGGGENKEYVKFEQPIAPLGNETGVVEGVYKMVTSFSYEWEGLEELDALLLNAGVSGSQISFRMPKLILYHLNGEQKNRLFEVPVKCEVFKQLYQDGNIVGTQTNVLTQYYNNPQSVPNRNDNIMYNNGSTAGIRAYRDDNYNMNMYNNIYLFKPETYTEFPAIVNLNDTNHSNAVVIFTTDVLTIDDINAKKSYRYSIKLTANPYYADSLITYYNKISEVKKHNNNGFWVFLGLQDPYYFNVSVFTNALNIINSNNIYIQTEFNCYDNTTQAPPRLFLSKGMKYSGLKLLRKALLTCDTRIFDNQEYGLDSKMVNGVETGIKYPIKIDPVWQERLNFNCYETVFEEKNLWEVLLQLGYYIHAIPYLEFDDTGEDCFVLKFRQLGDTKTKDDTNGKITIYNSRNLSEFFTQYDSYVTNLFSPQNEIEEWIVPKTSDASYLISNNTAELHLKYPIIELLEFDIKYNGETKSAIERVFEKNVYSILSNHYSRNATRRIVPAKGTSLYFVSGTNKIGGLNYVPPTANNDGLMALKDIVVDLFNVANPASIRFNDLSFHIKYRTQDNLRISQVRPDLQNFMKNSKFDKYPHHEQFYGQQDKIVDSERFSANLWGRLVRVGNNVYQRQEYVKNYLDMKESGDLVKIYNDSYYVISCENEFYPDIILQKVTYSKNFNQLSQIVTIPSEPRYYEVSERNTIRREVRLFDFISITTQHKSVDEPDSCPRFMNNSTQWFNLIKSLIFNDGNVSLPNFAYTKFFADQKRNHTHTAGGIIDNNQLFPSSDVQEITGNTISPVDSKSFSEVIVPLLHFPLKNAIIFEWDMEDNFKAGDSINENISGGNTDDGAYVSLQPIRYCDIMGRADLFNFSLFYKNDWSDNELQHLPKVVFNNFTSIFGLPSNFSIGLDKDNREALSFNYQICLVNGKNKEDKFITFPNLFGKKNGRLKLCFLSKSVSLFDESLSFAEGVLAQDVDYTLSEAVALDGVSNMPYSLCLKIQNVPNNIDISQIKSIVLYDEENGVKIAYIAKNVDNLSNNEKLKDWYIYPVFSEQE